MHNTPFAGNLGITRTLSSIRERYYRPGLHSIVSTYVKKCRDCPMFKRSHVNTFDSYNSYKAFRVHRG